jgi:hypothetical protein
MVVQVQGVAQMGNNRWVGLVGNKSINLKDGWFKGQRVQFRVDVEETVRF